MDLWSQADEDAITNQIRIDVALYLGFYPNQSVPSVPYEVETPESTLLRRERELLRRERRKKERAKQAELRAQLEREEYKAKLAVDRRKAERKVTLEIALAAIVGSGLGTLPGVCGFTAAYWPNPFAHSKVIQLSRSDGSSMCVDIDDYMAQLHTEGSRAR